MDYKIEKIDFLVKTITKKDNLFNGAYTIDPYQNCEFGCTYCDSTFNSTIKIKINAAEILGREIKSLKKGIIIIGSVNDPYQEAEKRYKITRDLLKIIKKYNFPCHILTKSDLVLRDIDILNKIDNCIVTISLISLNKILNSIFEKNLPLPKIRLQTINKLNNNRIYSGLAIIPIIPFLVENELNDIVKSAKETNARYVLFKYLELKGYQKKYFIDDLKKFYPDLVEKYEKLYKNSYLPNDKYIKNLKNIMSNLCKKYKIQNRIDNINNK